MEINCGHYIFFIYLFHAFRSTCACNSRLVPRPRFVLSSGVRKPVKHQSLKNWSCACAGNAETVFGPSSWHRFLTKKAIAQVLCAVTTRKMARTLLFDLRKKRSFVVIKSIEIEFVQAHQHLQMVSGEVHDSLRRNGFTCSRYHKNIGWRWLDSLPSYRRWSRLFTMSSDGDGTSTIASTG